MNGFRGIVPIRESVTPPSVRHYPMFPIDGEIPVIVRERGGVIFVDETQCAVIMLTTPAGIVCDQSSTPDLAARLFDVMKSDMSPWGIFHDTIYRYRLAGYCVIIRFKSLKEAYAFANKWAKTLPDKWVTAAFVKSVGGKFCKPDQEWADNAFRALLLTFNSEVLPSFSRKKAWAAVRLFGEDSFRDPEMAKTCAAVKRKILALENKRAV